MSDHEEWRKRQNRKEKPGRVVNKEKSMKNRRRSKKRARKYKDGELA